MESLVLRGDIIAAERRGQEPRSSDGYQQCVEKNQVHRCEIDGEVLKNRIRCRCHLHDESSVMIGMGHIVGKMLERYFIMASFSQHRTVVMRQRRIVAQAMNMECQIVGKQQ